MLFIVVTVYLDFRECQPLFLPKIAPVECDVTVSAEFVIERPKSHKTAAGAVKASAPGSPGKPDLDKLCRALLDGLTGVIYRDDSQVIYLNAMKRFGDRSETVVTISYAAR